MNWGLLGRELTSQGYVNIDGLDKSLGMLGQASQDLSKNSSWCTLMILQNLQHEDDNDNVD